MKRAVILVLACGCQDALDQRLAIVKEPRVLAIVAEPPEVRPGSDVMLTALAGGPDGALEAVPAWSLCAAPKPPTEDNAVADGCLADQVVALGSSATITATVPTDACRTFGPDVASTGFRPRDPDPTGGYYQPVRADLEALEAAFGFARITCNLANAPGDVAQAYRTMYVANANPTLDPLAIDGAPAPATVPANTAVTLVASWPSTAVESFFYFDPDTQRLVTRREAMRLSWFATGGTLAVDASAVAETDDTTSVTTTWHTPAAGPATLWIVLRDSRGGLATQTIALTVQ
jgi:hypothetical protein